jgi:hypothetical protein
MLGDLARDSTELDLWAFDDELDDETPPAVLPLARSSGGRAVPERRDSKPGQSNPLARVRGAEDAPSAEPVDQIRMNVGKPAEKKRNSGGLSIQPKLVDDLDDLEQWDAPQEESEWDELQEILTEEDILKDIPLPLQSAAPEQMPTSVPPMPVSAPVKEAKTVSGKPAGEDDEFSPALREGAVPLSLRPHMGLTKVEKAGAITLLALLLVGGLVTYLFSVNRLPTESVRAKANDYPIKGARLVVDTAASYWRAPIVDGPTPDVFRRGTELLPVVEIAVSSGTGAIRVVFRNESRGTVGDSITRAASGKDLLKIVATAGFDDMGMYAAYRTGGDKPWTIEVLEGPSVDAPSAEFKRLFEMELSTAIH